MNYNSGDEEGVGPNHKVNSPKTNHSFPLGSISQVKLLTRNTFNKLLQKFNFFTFYKTIFSTDLLSNCLMPSWLRLQV